MRKQTPNTWIKKSSKKKKKKKRKNRRSNIKKTLTLNYCSGCKKHTYVCYVYCMSKKTNHDDKYQH